MNLLDGVGATVASTVTAGGGVYSFPGLVPAAYRVEFVTPGGYSISPADQGGDDSLDSDANPGTGQTPLTTLSSGESELTFDAGMYELASIGDFVWLDSDADGVQDGGEVGLDGVTVNLLDGVGATVASTVTAGGGAYSFPGFLPGDYRVEFVTPGGHSISPADQGGDDSLDSDANPGTGQTALTALTSGENELTFDAGMYLGASIGDLVWTDLDADGVQDGGEVGLDGVTVNLLDGVGATVASTVTAGGGVYLFPGLVPGDYRVEFVAPAGLSISPVDQGGDDNLDSDANPGTGQTPFITLSSGGSDSTFDAGMYQPASIGDFVWVDSDADGVQDGGEVGLDAVVVNLLDGVGATVASTVTAGGGAYAFPGLVPGDYRVEFVAAGYTISPADQGGDDSLDSDANPGTGQTPLTTLTSGEAEVTFDVGMYQPASIGDFVWTDLDADGVQDGGEVGLDGVTVNLLDGVGATVASTVTAGGGVYSFSALIPGDYRVEFIALPGYTVTPADQGGDDSLDSDANPGTGLTPLITLSSGENEFTSDAGMFQPASIGDFVWVDSDADGVQDGGEVGLDGVTVNLLDGVGATVGSAVTAGGGAYAFTGLVPGEYRVEFVAPAGYSISDADQGGDDSLDSDANPGTGQSPLTTVGSGETIVSLDAGMYQVAAVGDFVWTDDNADGIRDIGELGLGAVTVNLLDGVGATVASTVTAGDGSYSFAGLTPGDYRVEFAIPASYTVSPADQGGDDTLDSDANPGTGHSPLTTLLSGETNSTLDAGMYQLAAIADRVWSDSDADGIQDPGSSGIGGVTVNLLDGVGATLATTVTAADGSYAFTGLTPGEYRVEFVTAPGHVISLVDQGIDDAVDSDADPGTGQTALVTVGSGETDLTVDAGMYEPASIGDFVWTDLDADGVQDGGEPGLDGVTVNLLDGLGATVSSTVTAGGGAYSFPDLVPGDYILEFVSLPGLTFSPADQGGDDTADSDANPLSGRAGIITLMSGDDVGTVDAGLFAGALIGDFVWEDIDGDGIQDVGEPGLAGVTVDLLDAGGTVVATTLTDAGGLYSFSVVPGTYQVKFLAPMSHEFSIQDAGVDDTIDSDADAISGRAPTVVVSSGDSVIDIDAGLYVPATIGDTVFFDIDGDGDQDTDEPGIVGITLELRDSSGSLVATTVTGPDGHYEFSSLPPDDYDVSAVPVADMSDTTPNPQPHQVGSGDEDDTADFGMRGSGSIGELVWLDLDGNGELDDDEVGIDGAAVELVWSGVDGVLGTPDDLLLSTTTIDGAYLFTGLPSGPYRVTVDEATLPPETVVTASPDGGLDLVADLVLAPGGAITYANFAITPDAPLAFTGFSGHTSIVLAVMLVVTGAVFLLLADVREREGRRRADGFL